jgi:hypothetical protein
VGLPASISLLHICNHAPPTPHPRTPSANDWSIISFFRRITRILTPTHAFRKGLAALDVSLDRGEQINLPLGDHANAVEGSLEQSVSNLLSFLLGLGSRTITSQGTISYKTRTWKNTDAFGSSIFNSLGPTPAVANCN